jgi:hypothetical protein
MAKNVMRVGVDLELSAVGKFLSDMQAREGVLNIHLNLPDEKYKPDPALPRGAGSAMSGMKFHEAIVQAIVQHGPATNHEVKALLPSFPKANSQYSGTLNYLGKTGRLVCNPKDRKWSLTEKYRKHLANGSAGPIKPPPGANGHAAPRKQPVQREMTGGELILDNMKAGKPITLTEMAALFVKDGRSSRSVNDQLSKLIKARKLKRVGKATYELTAAGAK